MPQILQTPQMPMSGMSGLLPPGVGVSVEVEGATGILIIIVCKGTPRALPSFQLFFYVFNAYALHPVKDHLIPNNCNTIFQYISLEERPVLQPRHKKPLLSYSGTVYFK